jgi:uncharacterized protein YegP (UPF0339 family)
MTVRLKMYNAEETYLQYYKDSEGLYRWRVLQGDDIIASSHQGWTAKEQCEYNAQYLITSEWDIQT